MAPPESLENKGPVGKNSGFVEIAALPTKKGGVFRYRKPLGKRGVKATKW